MAISASSDSKPVVTGIGVVAPNGIGARSFWDTLLRAEGAVNWVTSGPPTSSSEKWVGGCVSDSELLQLSEENPLAFSRLALMELVAARMALSEADVQPSLSQSLGAIAVVTARNDRSGPHSSWDSKGNRVATRDETHGKISEWLCAPVVPVRAMEPNASAALQLVAVAAQMIREGTCPLAMVIASDALVPIASQHLPTAWSNPARASRPFDRDRFGSIPAEAAAAIIIEAESHARARGAAYHIEVAGFASVTDVPQDKPFAMLRAAILQALANAGETAQNIGYIAAFAPSDPLLDRVETQAIKAALGTYAYRVPVSSIKGVTGHAPTTSGLLQLAAVHLAAEYGIIPPTANYENADPACDLDYVPAPRRAEFSAALIHAHTSGGQNHALIARRLR